MKLFTHDTKVEALSAAPLFQGLTGKELEELAMRTEDLDFPAGFALSALGAA